jgi:hypothetical protein
MKKNIIFILFIFINTAISVFAQEAKQSQDYNKTMAQVYRWFLYYENKQIPIQNHLKTITENARIQNPSISAKGKKEYMEALKNWSPTWQHAHHVEKITIKRRSKDNISVKMQVSYQNLGYRDNNKLASLKLNYDIVLIDGEDILPLIDDLDIGVAFSWPNSKYAELFISSYVENRAKSLIHYWLYLIQSNNLEQVKEIVAKNFDLKSINPMEYQDSYLDSIDVIEQNDLSYKLNVVFAKMNSVGQKEIISQIWIIQDNFLDDFATISTIQ